MPKKALAGARRRLELPVFSQHSLRRMFITRAIEKGVDVKVIADWQGHRDGGKLILDTYSHVNPVHSHRMAQLMANEQVENVVVFEQSGTAMAFIFVSERRDRPTEHWRCSFRLCVVYLRSDSGSRIASKIAVVGGQFSAIDLYNRIFEAAQRHLAVSRAP